MSFDWEGEVRPRSAYNGYMLKIMFFLLLVAGNGFAARVTRTTRQEVKAYVNKIPSANLGAGFTTQLRFINLSTGVQTISVKLSNESMALYSFTVNPVTDMTAWSSPTQYHHGQNTNITRPNPSVTITIPSMGSGTVSYDASCVFYKAVAGCTPTTIPLTPNCNGGDIEAGEQRASYNFDVSVSIAEDNGAVLGSLVTDGGLCGGQNVIQNGRTSDLNGGRPF